MAQTLMYSHHKNFSKCLVSAINGCKSLYSERNLESSASLPVSLAWSMLSFNVLR